jgi:hypothetical protein
MQAIRSSFLLSRTSAQATGDGLCSRFRGRWSRFRSNRVRPSVEGFSDALITEYRDALTARLCTPALSSELASISQRAPVLRTFIAFFSQVLAIFASVCFHDSFNASAEEVHMMIHWTNRQMSKPCAGAAADHPALLG